MSTRLPVPIVELEALNDAVQRSVAPEPRPVPAAVFDELRQRRSPSVATTPRLSPPANTSDSEAGSEDTDKLFGDLSLNKLPNETPFVPSYRSATSSHDPDDLNVTQASQQQLQQRQFWQDYQVYQGTPVHEPPRALSRASSAFQKVRHVVQMPQMLPRQTSPDLMPDAPRHTLCSSNLVRVQEAYEEGQRRRPASTSSSHSTVTLNAASTQDLQQALARRRLQEGVTHVHQPVPQPPQLVGHQPPYDGHQGLRPSHQHPQEAYSPGTEFGRSLHGQQPFSFAPEPNTAAYLRPTQATPTPSFSRQQIGTPLSAAHSALSHGPAQMATNPVNLPGNGFDQARYAPTLLTDLNLMAGVSYTMEDILAAIRRGKVLPVDTTRKPHQTVELADTPMFHPDFTTFPAFHRKFIPWRDQSAWSPQETTQRLLKCLAGEAWLLIKTVQAALGASGDPYPQCRDHVTILQILAMKFWDPITCQGAQLKFLTMSQEEDESIHHYIIRYYEAMAGLSLTATELRQPLERGVHKKHHSLFQTIDVKTLPVDAIVSFLLDKIGMVEDPALRQRGNPMGHPLTAPQTAMVNQVNTDGTKQPFRYNRALDKAKAAAMATPTTSASSGFNKGGNPKIPAGGPTDGDSAKRRNPDEYSEGAICEFCGRKNHTQDQCRALKAQLKEALAQGVIRFVPRPPPPKKD